MPTFKSKKTGRAIRRTGTALTKYKRVQRKNKTVYRKKKANFAAKRNSFVEVKGRSHSDFWAYLGGAPGVNAIVDHVQDPRVLKSMTGESPTFTPLVSAFMPLWSYMNPIQGVTEKDMLGTTLTAKYLTAKIMFNFPDNVQLKNPRYYMVHGWVKIAPNLSPYTTPNKAAFTRKNFIDHIYNHIKVDFDEHTKNEFLQFKERSNKDYIVLGYRRVAPNQVRQQITPAAEYNTAGVLTLHGKPSPKQITVKWPLNNRKIKYTRGTNNDTIITEGVPFYYDNKGFAPFLLYYCPDAGTLVAAGEGFSPSISYDNKLWFSDS